MMLLGRTTSLIVTRWYVRRHVSIARRFIQVWAALKCVTPYFMLWLCIDFWSMSVGEGILRPGGGMHPP
jgi:hypothetical protein